MRLLILILATAQLVAADAPDWRRPVATYSIVARDSLSGQLGVAVQSHWFSVGPIVPWVPSFRGPVPASAPWLPSPSSTRPMVRSGLELMAMGKTAQEALTALLAGTYIPSYK